ncbi:MAG: endonuclease/exonuclease/phosphatase family protein [Myxococcota bacterium]
MTLRVLTLNLWHDAGPWRERLKQLREWLDRLDPDLIGLQEVLRGAQVDQCAELFEGRDYHWDYVRASDFWDQRGLDFGNAIASRWPIQERAELRLPDAGDGERRAALQVCVASPFGPISITNTHLNWKFHHGAVRERQVVALCDWLWEKRPRDGFPPLLVGDFNAEPESSEIRYLSGFQSLKGKSVALRDAWRCAGQTGEGLTWSNRNPYARPWLEPDRRIDYIFAGPPRPGGVGLIEACRVVCDTPRDGVWPSDHFGLSAQLRTDPLPDLDHDFAAP